MQPVPEKLIWATFCSRPRQNRTKGLASGSHPSGINHKSRRYIQRLADSLATGNSCARDSCKRARPKAPLLSCADGFLANPDALTQPGLVALLENEWACNEWGDLVREIRVANTRLRSQRRASGKVSGPALERRVSGTLLRAALSPAAVEPKGL